MATLTGLAPLADSRTRVLVLGSFPGAASLAAQQYYGHPQNHFWRLLAAIFQKELHASVLDNPGTSYPLRVDWMLSHGVGVWDVYVRCEREGSLDSRIRRAVVNDFSQLRQRCPALQATLHNGVESFKHAGQLAALGVPAHRLPSTSPANASWSFARKVAAWRLVFEQYGLV